MTKPADNRFQACSALRNWRGWLAFVAALAMAIATTAATAQETPRPPAAESSATTETLAPEAADGEPTEPVPLPQVQKKAGRIQYVGPDTYILLDAQGRPQPVPGMTYEDFLKAWKSSHQAAMLDATPRYVLESVDMEGRTRENFAEFDFVATIRPLVDGQVEVPLGLMGAILQGQPQFAPANNNRPPMTDAPNDEVDEAWDERGDYVTQDPDAGGTVVHLSGRAGQRKRVSFELIVPLSRDGAESALQLSCPRAVSSKLTLTTPSAVTDTSVNSGTLVEQDPVSDGGTRLVVAGAVGPFRVTWRSAERATTEYATVLSAAGAIRVAVDGRSVRTEAQLRVQSFGGGFDRFRVRLPPGAQLVPDVAVDADAQRPKYRLTFEDAGNDAANSGEADSGSVVLIEFPEKQLAPVTIDLATEQPIGLKDEASAVELAGFEVLGAVRQFGDVALQVADDWQARWKIGNHVRQVDTEDLEASLQQPNLSAAFQYDRQPWSLGVRVESRQTRVHVTPQYDLQFLPDEARLSLRLNYQVYGARAFEFQVRMKGWQITGSPLESGGLVDLDKILRGEDDTLTLPLSQASTPRAEITLALRYPLARDQRTYKLPLPVPIAASIGTGDVTIRSGTDFELQPDLQSSVGLAPVTSPDSSEVQNDSGAALHFRSVLPDAVFVADRFDHAQQISAATTARVEVSPSGGRVEQQFDFDVQYKPIEELLFETTNELWFAEDQMVVVLLSSAPNDAPDAAVSETPLSIVPAPEDMEITNSGASMRIRVPLPQPRLGQFSVQVRYRPSRPDAATAAVEWQLPLVRTVNAELTKMYAQVKATNGLSVGLNAKAENPIWKPASTSSQSERSGFGNYYIASGEASVLPLVIAASDSGPPSAATVERVWLQSWYSGGTRQDRAAIRFRTSGAQATVELPPRSSASETEVLLDGVPADVVSRDGGRIVVRVQRGSSDNDESANARSADHTLELRSRTNISGGLLTRHQLTPPQLVGGKALSQVYWQIVLPGDEHIVRSPARMSSASQWQWLGGFWGQRPVMLQPELEKWVSASSQIAPTAAQNEYLYTGLAPAFSIELITAPRWLIVFAASSSVLAIGLVWMYVPAARQGWIVAAAACLIAALAVAFPLPALLLAQSAAIGVVAAILALLLKRATARPTHWPVTPSGGSSQRQFSPRAESMLMPSPMSAASTAPTVPLRISDSQQ